MGPGRVPMQRRKAITEGSGASMHGGTLLLMTSLLLLPIFPEGTLVAS